MNFAIINSNSANEDFERLDEYFLSLSLGMGRRCFIFSYRNENNLINNIFLLIKYLLIAWKDLESFINEGEFIRQDNLFERCEQYGSDLKGFFDKYPNNIRTIIKSQKNGYDNILSFFKSLCEHCGSKNEATHQLKEMFRNGFKILIELRSFFLQMNQKM